MGQIRSRLVTFTVTAKDRESGKTEQWEITLQGNRIREDRADWLKNANRYFSDIELTRHTQNQIAAQYNKANKAAQREEIAREGLKLLDQLIAARTS